MSYQIYLKSTKKQKWNPTSSWRELPYRGQPPQQGQEGWIPRKAEPQAGIWRGGGNIGKLWSHLNLLQLTYLPHGLQGQRLYQGQGRFDSSGCDPSPVKTFRFKFISSHLVTKGKHIWLPCDGIYDLTQKEDTKEVFLYSCIHHEITRFAAADTSQVL